MILTVYIYFAKLGVNELMLQYNSIIGAVSEEKFHNLVHEMEHRGKVDYIDISNSDLSRRRFRQKTRSGKEIAISLNRNSKLFDGAILELSGDTCLVVKVVPEKWLKVKAIDPNLNMKLGYFAGNLHWAVRFSEEAMFIEIKSTYDEYLGRLKNAFNLNELSISEVDAI